MKFGMPALVECKDVYDCIDVAKKNGLDFVEINMSFPQYLPDLLDIPRLKKALSDNGIFLTIHTDEQMNPFDFNKSVAECYFEEMRKVIRFAVDLGIPTINMHLLRGVYVTLPGKVVLLTDVYKEEYLRRLDDFIAMCEREIGDAPLKICIENVDTNAFTKSQLEAMPKFMASDVFFLTLDVGHEMCLEYKDSHVFEKYPDKLYHMHLHDCDGKKPHLALGDGIMDIEKKLSGFHGPNCLVEVKTIEGLEKSAKYLKAKGYISR